jgi:predicted nucleotidyltransferase
MDINSIIRARKNEIFAACNRHRVGTLHLFGSAVRENFDPKTSDIDFLVQFQPMPSFERVDAYYGLQEELSELLGIPVDLVMAEAIRNPYIAADINRTKQPLYAA